MPLTLEDMSLARPVQALSSLSTGTQALINNIIAESNASNIASAGGTGTKQAFFNHSYDKDPATNGGVLGLQVSVSIYYMPSNKNEYDNWEVIDGAIGMLSGRRRLAVRTANGKVSFYTTSHPKKRIPGVPNNTYTIFTAIDTTK